MQTRLAIRCLDPCRAAAAHKLSDQLGLPLIDEAQAQAYDYLLTFTPERLELRPADPSQHGPVYVDFIGGKSGYRLRSQEGRKQPLGRAIGLKPGYNPTVVDGTAGLGRDGFVIATLGCQVRLVERSSIIAALLADGMQRALSDQAVATIISERLQLINADSAHYLASLDQQTRPDVIYLDPMYPHRNKSALVKKEMRAFRLLVGDDVDAGEMLTAALCCARRRVVVKRPKGAEPLPGPAPSMVIQSTNTRYDVYLCKSDQ